MKKRYNVWITFDHQYKIWVVSASEVPGLWAEESLTKTGLVETATSVYEDLLEEEDFEDEGILVFREEPSKVRPLRGPCRLEVASPPEELDGG